MSMSTDKELLQNGQFLIPDNMLWSIFLSFKIFHIEAFGLSKNSLFCFLFGGVLMSLLVVRAA